MNGDSATILNPQNWLYFRVYRRRSTNDTWRSQLDWYHDVLRTILKPWVHGYQEIGFILFSIYGPEGYQLEGQPYLKQISPAPSGQVEYMRLRAFVTNNRETVKENLATKLDQRSAQVVHYEILDGYRVRDDLGSRYGRIGGAIDDQVTIRFVRYWDASCRYILEILGSSGNWSDDVDVWGVPHLTNNSLGGWLRLSHVQCPKCHAKMYMPVGAMSLSQPQQFSNVPAFIFFCPQCTAQVFGSTNI